MDDQSVIKIEKLIIHILDSDVQIPIFSDQELLLDADIEEFIYTHLHKILEDEASRHCEFVQQENGILNFCLELADNIEAFNDISKEIASTLYNIMQKNPDIPSADLVIVLFQLDGVNHLAVLKLNYKTSFIHHIEHLEEGRVNSIIKQKTALPTEKQRIDEAAIINLETLQIQLIEKSYELNGEKEFYFSNRFLKCIGEMSTKEKLKVFKKVTEDINKKYYNDDIEKKAEIKKAVQESIIDSGKIEFEEVAEKVFQNNTEVREMFMDSLQQPGIKNTDLELSEKTAQRNFQKQKLKTDTGIEINIPLDFYGDPSKLELITNPDGTVSILIKNINKITGR
jgi:hypothetical protein